MVAMLVFLVVSEVIGVRRREALYEAGISIILYAFSKR